MGIITFTSDPRKATSFIVGIVARKKNNVITQRKFDELQLAAQARAEALFEKWLAQFLGRRAEREEEPSQEEAAPVDELIPEVENA